METFTCISKKDLEEFISNGFQECVRLIYSKDSNQELVGLAQFEILNTLRIDAQLTLRFPFSMKQYREIMLLIPERRHVFHVVKQGLHNLESGSGKQ